MAKSIKEKYLARLVRYIKDKKTRDAIIAASKEREIEKKLKKTDKSDLDSNDKE